MPDLVAFLRARLNEENSRARAAERAAGAPWSTGSPAPYDTSVVAAAGDPLALCPDCGVRGGFAVEVAVHIAGQDPARVLADVEAKRAIIRHASLAILMSDRSPDDDAHARIHGAATVAEQVLELIAAAYRDHPDYREEWAP